MKKHRWLWIITSILCGISGIVVIFNPAIELASLSILLAVVMMFSGFSQVGTALAHKGAKGNSYLILWGILSIIIAVWVLSSNFETLVGLVPFVFAFWIVLGGTSRIVVGIELLRKKVDGGKLFFFAGIIGIIIGCVLFYHPRFTGFMINYLIAALLIYEAVMSIVHFAKDDAFSLE